MAPEKRIKLFFRLKLSTEKVDSLCVSRYGLPLRQGSTEFIQLI